MPRLEKSVNRKFQLCLWVLTIVCVLTVLITGCGDQLSTEWKGRSGGSLVTIVDDSLAIVRNGRGYETCESKLLTGDICEDGGSHTGLYLVNYQSKSLPIWGDTLNYSLSFVEGYYQDSMVMVYNDKNQFGFWKIGGKPELHKTWHFTSPCRIGLYSSLKARPWRNGGVLVLGLENCPYALLDTASGMVVQKEFMDDDLGLNICSDVTHLNESIVCLQPIVDDLRYGVYLKVNNILRDSLIWNTSSWQIAKNLTGWYTNTFWINHPTELFNGMTNPISGKQLYKLDVDSRELKPIVPNVWIKENCFQNTENLVCYNAEDLIEGE